MSNQKVIGKIEVVIAEAGKVIIKSEDGTQREATFGDVIYEGEQIVSSDPEALVQVKYLALPNASVYEDVFTVLTDNSVITVADADKNTTLDLNNLETSSGNSDQTSSSAVIAEDSGTGSSLPTELVVDRGVDGTLGQGIIDSGTSSVLDLKAKDSEKTQNEPLQIIDQAPPVITSANQVIFDENSDATVLTVTADDESSVNYSLEDALDAELFSIDTNTGALSFNEVPNFEAPQDLGVDNEYNLHVTVSDELGNFTTQAVSVYVNNLNEAPMIMKGETTASLVEDLATSEVSIQSFIGETTEEIQDNNWTFTTEGGNLQIDMTSATFDTYLKIYDANDVLVAQNDDGAAGYNSRLVLDLDAGSYTVVAGGANNESGEYQLDFFQTVTMTEMTKSGSALEESTTELLTQTGNIAFSDVDVNDSHTASVSSDDTNLGNLNASVVDGQIVWDYAVNNSDVQYLAQGETRVETFTITLEDNNGLSDTQEVSVTINGTNDVPVIETQASEVSATVNEDVIAQVYTAQTAALDENNRWTVTHDGGDFAVSMNSTEIDTFLVVYDEHGEAVIAVNDDGGTESNSKVLLENLPAGTYTVEALGYDHAQGSYEISFETALSSLTGPEGQTLSDTTNITASGVMIFSELDVSDMHEIIARPSVKGNLGELNAEITYDSGDLGTGNITWNYSVDNADVQYLAEGETKVETFNVSVIDNNRASSTQEVSVTITGSNDAPIITEGETTASLVEDLATSEVSIQSFIGETTEEIQDNNWTFTTEGGNLQIDMTSATFDTYLKIYCQPRS